MYLEIKATSMYLNIYIVLMLHLHIERFGALDPGLQLPIRLPDQEYARAHARAAPM